MQISNLLLTKIIYMEKQELKFVTCSGANEFTNISDIVALSERFPIIEWGIQASGKKCAKDSDRFRWIKELQHFLKDKHQAINLALHLNEDWVDGYTSGTIPEEVETLLDMRDCNNAYLFKRIQLNFKIGRNKDPHFSLLMERLLTHAEGKRFILSFNPSNETFIHQMYRYGLRDFDVLYDSSHGEGITASKWKEPAFFDDGILQGYAGGLSPDNVANEIAKIRKVIPYNGSFYIDAEGKLKGDDKHLSLNKCKEYVCNALQAMNF